MMQETNSLAEILAKTLGLGKWCEAKRHFTAQSAGIFSVPHDFNDADQHSCRMGEGN